MKNSTPDTHDGKLIGLAFGDPLSYKTFSGYSRHLFLALRQMDALAETFSTRIIKWYDLFYGYRLFSRMLKWQRPELSANWLWNEATIRKLSCRLQDRLAGFDEKVPVLQVGAHVYPVNTARQFYCVADMTVRQAADSHQFLIRQLDRGAADRAIEVQRKMFDTYAKIFALSGWTAKSIIEDYGQSPEKVVVIGAGANMGPLPPDADKYSSRQILFVGLDWVRKGGPVLLEAFRIVRRQIPDAVLNIVGCSPHVSGPGVNVIGILRKQIHSEKQHLENLYKSANCFCILPPFDPFPNVLLEAQITATPVVSINSGSRHEAVKSGILVDHPTATNVANAIINVLSNPALAEQMGRAGKSFILENYTWPKVAKKILSHISGPGTNNFEALSKTRQLCQAE